MTAALAVRPLTGPRRFGLFAVFGAVVLGCAVYLAVMIRDMSALPAAMAVKPLSLPYIAGLFVMWTVMQAVMMLPSALPMTHAYARMCAGGVAGSRLFGPVALFVIGYGAVWSAFSLTAALLQAGLTAGALLSPMAMKLAGGPVAGTVLVAAGVYQWLPLKQACLRKCRTPLGFLMTEWRDGRLGAVVMGWRHGLFCVGCCWAVMGVLFVGGVMNPIWIAAIAGYVLVEKVVPQGAAFSKLAGLALIGGGFWLMAS